MRDIVVNREQFKELMENIPELAMLEIHKPPSVSVYARIQEEFAAKERDLHTYLFVFMAQQNFADGETVMIEALTRAHIPVPISKVDEATKVYFAVLHACFHALMPFIEVPEPKPAPKPKPPKPGQPGYGLTKTIGKRAANGFAVADFAKSRK